MSPTDAVRCPIRPLEICAAASLGPELRSLGLLPGTPRSSRSSWAAPRPRAGPSGSFHADRRTRRPHGHRLHRRLRLPLAPTLHATRAGDGAPPPTLDREKVHGYALKRGEPWVSPSRAPTSERCPHRLAPRPHPVTASLGGEATGSRIEDVPSWRWSAATALSTNASSALVPACARLSDFFSAVGVQLRQYRGKTWLHTSP